MLGYVMKIELSNFLHTFMLNANKWTNVKYISTVLIVAIGNYISNPFNNHANLIKISSFSWIYRN